MPVKAAYMSAVLLSTAVKVPEKPLFAHKVPPRDREWIYIYSVPILR